MLWTEIIDRLKEWQTNPVTPLSEAACKQAMAYADDWRRDDITPPVIVSRDSAGGLRFEWQNGSKVFFEYYGGVSAIFIGNFAES